MSDINENKGSAYEAMAEAVKTSFEQLLIPFHAASEPHGLLRDMTTEAFFQKFLVYADKFTGQCCQDFSKILRRASVVPEVRGTPTLQLAKQLREVVFEMPDKILVGYVGALRQINLDLMGVAGSIADTSVLGEAMKGAAIGRVAGGFGETGKVLGAVGAMAAAGQEAMKQAALLEQRKQLEAQATGLAFSKILEYLKAIEALPENLLDYGCAKCFGGQIDFSRQAQAVQQIQASNKPKLEQALNFALRFQKDELERTSRAAAVQAEKLQKNKEAADSATNKGCGGCLVVVGIALVIAVIGMAVDAAPNGAPEEVGVGFVVGGVLLGFGIYLLAKKNSP